MCVHGGGGGGSTTILLILTHNNSFSLKNLKSVSKWANNVYASTHEYQLEENLNFHYPINYQSVWNPIIESEANYE